MYVCISLRLDQNNDRVGISRCLSNCPKLFGFELPKEIKILFKRPLPEDKCDSVLFSTQLLTIPKECILKFFQSRFSKSFKSIFFLCFIRS